MQKKCAKCGEVKPVEAFFRNSKKKDGRMNQCKDCYNSKYHQSADYRRQHRYGVSPEQFQELLVAQGNRCATCGTAPEKFYIDHDHTCCQGTKSCGECVRGLLCFNCNTALGQVKDNPATLLAMVEYLTAGDN